MRLISKIIGNQEKPVSNSGDSLGLPVTLTGNPLSFIKDTPGLASNTVITLEPIQAGTGDPSPSNVRAISGYDRVNVVVPRKNLWKYKDVEGTGWVYKTFDTFLPAGTYTISAVVTSSDTDTSTCLFTGTPVGETEAEGLIQMPRSSGGARVSGTFITNKPLYSLGFYAASYGLGGEGDTFSWKDIQIEEGSTATSYEPYNPLTDLSIAMPGTVYGGTLDVESGELVVDRIKVVLNGTQDIAISKYQSSGHYVQYNAEALFGYPGKNAGRVISDRYKSSNDGNDCIYLYKNTNPAGYNIVIQDARMGSTILSNSDWNSILSANPVTVVYELATPITYHLTPHQVALLQGANVVTTNGTSISLTHRQGEIAAQSDLVALAESVNEMDKGSVSVISGSSETYGSILTKLASILDPKKITHNAKIKVINSDGLALIYILGLIDAAGALYFYCSTSGTTNLAIDRLTMAPNGAGTKYTQQVTSSGFSSTNHTSTSFSGMVILYY